MIKSGTRIGFWKNNFKAVGYYTGPDIGPVDVGTEIRQHLEEGTLVFKLGILFRHDLGESQKLEKILILGHHVPEMFEYDDWEKQI